MRTRRREIVDEYVEDGRAAVYSAAGMVLLLSELATSAWQVIGDDWVTSDLVAEHLVREYGQPGDGHALQLTEDALQSLADRDLVELEEAEAADDKEW